VLAALSGKAPPAPAQAAPTNVHLHPTAQPVQREAVGTFVAPFEGSHGWYWENRGTQSVKVDIEVSGFQSELYRP